MIPPHRHFLKQSTHVTTNAFKLQEIGKHGSQVVFGRIFLSSFNSYSCVAVNQYYNDPVLICFRIPNSGGVGRGSRERATLHAVYSALIGLSAACGHRGAAPAFILHPHTAWQGHPIGTDPNQSFDWLKFLFIFSLIINEHYRHDCNNRWLLHSYCLQCNKHTLNSKSFTISVKQAGPGIMDELVWLNVLSSNIVEVAHFINTMRFLAYSTVSGCR